MAAPASSTAPSRRLARRHAGALLALVLLASVAAGALAGPASAAPAAPEVPAEPALHVALAPDGSARVTLVVVFDLATASDRAGFEAVAADATARERRLAAFAARLRAVADRAAAATGRPMAVRDPQVAFVEREGVGVVALSVTWDGLAARSGDALVLGEPFGDGFALDRPLHVVGPEGYALEAASPATTASTATSASWSPSSSVDGVEATFVPAATSADAPGFGPGAALLAVVLAAVLVGARSRYARR